MTQVEDTSRTMRLDPDSFAHGYFRNAVYRHWDPYEDIPQELLEADRRRLVEWGGGEEEFDALRGTLALFGAGEEAVTEDLAPLAIVLDDVDDQMFLTTQLYEEAKHTAFFDRYWREVVNPVAEERGFEVTNPTDQRYFTEDYVALFDKTEAAMHRLLTDDTPENRAKAYCHYHLVVESVLAQTGYYGIQASYSPTGPEMLSDEVEFVHLEGLVEGITRIRSDEGRHVGFGMHQVRELIQSGQVDPDVVQDTLQELMGHVAGTVAGNAIVDPTPLVEYAQDKLARRVEILTNAEAELPPVEELVKIEGAEPAAGD